MVPLLLLAAQLATAAPFVYVATGNSIAVVDVVTNAVVATVPVGTNPQGVAVNYNGAFVYVANRGSNNVSVISTATNTVVATIPAGSNPSGIAVNAAGTRVYVTNFGSPFYTVISTATNSVIANIPMPPLHALQAAAVAVHPAGTFVYFSGAIGHVDVLDTATNTFVFDAGGFDYLGIAAAPGGGFWYVVDPSFNEFQIWTTANAYVTALPLIPNPYALAVNPAGTIAYVTHSPGNTVTAINLVTNTIITTFVVGSTPSVSTSIPPAPWPM